MQIQRANQQLLLGLDDKAAGLVRKDFTAGLQSLELAAASTQSTARATYMTNALDRFRLAAANDALPAIFRAQASIFLGVAARDEGDVGAARLWATKAVDNLNAADTAAKQAQSEVVKRRRKIKGVLWVSSMLAPPLQAAALGREPLVNRLTAPAHEAAVRQAGAVQQLETAILEFAQAVDAECFPSPDHLRHHENGESV